MKSRIILFLGAALAFSGTAFAADSETTPADTTKKQCFAPSAEMAAWEKSALELYDINGNGVLDADERAALRADVEAGKFTPPPLPPRGGRGGPGKHRPPAEVLQKYDADGDGVLNATEEAKLRADIESGAFTPPKPPDGDGHGKGRRPPPPPSEDDNGSGVPTD